MKINFTDRGVLEIEDARIIFRNFSGVSTKYNREGDRNFSVIIPNQELADELLNDGWNVKIRGPREVGDDPFIHLPVKIKFNNRGPAVYIKSGENVKRLSEDTVGMIDDIDILSVDMDIRPYDWEVNDKQGRTAYLQAIQITQNIDRFGAKFVEDDLPF